MTPDPHELSDGWRALLLVSFGVSTSGVILAIGETGARPFDLLLLASSLGAVLTAGLWLWILAAKRSFGWGLLFAATALIPYVNFVVASVYARRYWNEGTRKPALLALVAITVQTIVSLRVFLPGISPPV